MVEKQVESSALVFQKASHCSSLQVGKITDTNLSHLLLSWTLLQKTCEVKQIAVFLRQMLCR